MKKKKNNIIEVNSTVPAVKDPTQNTIHTASTVVALFSMFDSIFNFDRTNKNRDRIKQLFC